MTGGGIKDALRLALGLSTLMTAVVGGVYLAWNILGQTNNLMYVGTFILSIFVLMGLVVRYLSFMWLGKTTYNCLISIWFFIIPDSIQRICIRKIIKDHVKTPCIHSSRSR